MRIYQVLLLICRLCICIYVAYPIQGRSETNLVFIVNQQNSIRALDSNEVADFFLKKQTYWPDGTPVRFIDWKEGSATRAAFLEHFIGKSSREVELYWIGQKLYSGDSAPIRVSSDSMVVRFVSRFKGAIGYLVNKSAAHSPGVKQIEVVGNH